MVFYAGLRLRLVCHDDTDADVVYEEVKKLEKLRS